MAFASFCVAPSFLLTCYIMALKAKGTNKNGKIAKMKKWECNENLTLTLNYCKDKINVITWIERIL